MNAVLLLAAGVLIGQLNTRSGCGANAYFIASGRRALPLSLTVALIFTIGAAAGAACAAMAGYGAGRPLPWGVAAGCLAAVAAFAVWWHVTGRTRFPGDRAGIQANRQLAQSGPGGTLYFGLLLGVGFRTRMATPLWYAIPLAAAASGIGAALAVGVGAGLGRSWPVARALADSLAESRAAAAEPVSGAAPAGPVSGAAPAGLRIATPRRSDAVLAVAAVVIMGAALAASHL